MADEGAVAVAEAPVVDVSSTESVDDVSTQSTDTQDTPQEKLDGRNQPDSLKKRIAELRRQADTITDPTQKAALLADAKELNNRVGKVAAYEQTFPTVREARESKTLIDSFGGREGLLQTQQTLQRVTELDQQLEQGNPAAAEAMWKEAPAGMVKLAPMIFAQLEQNAPQDYEREVIPHAIKYFEKGGFLNAINELYKGLNDGDANAIHKTVKNMEAWFNARKSQTEQRPQANPEVERLRKENEDLKSGDNKKATDAAYNQVVQHAGPVIDKYLRPIVAKLGLTQEQYQDLRQDTWNHLQSTRNADQTYITVSNAKLRQGMDVAAAYIKGETEARANDAARAMANRRYGHQLKNGAVVRPNPTATPVTPGITRGKEPSPSEIDYSSKGVQAAKKAGFKDLADMILAGRAPLKAGGVRQWR